MVNIDLYSTFGIPDKPLDFKLEITGNTRTINPPTSQPKITLGGGLK